jgi:serine/threonine-protein kinase HipA
MKVGGEYELDAIGIRQWHKLAREIRVDPDEMISRLRAMATRLPDEARAAAAKAKNDGLSSSTIDRLVVALVARADKCRKILDAR